MIDERDNDAKALALDELDPRTGLGTHELRHELRRRIGERQLARAPSYSALAREAQSQFDERAQEMDLEGFCDLVLNRLSLTGAPGTSTVEWFGRVVLGFPVLPGTKRAQLLARTLDDLGTVEGLITTYETDPMIRAQLSGGKRRGRNHEERVVMTFYERCLAERAAITRYLAHDIDRTAVDQADEFADLLAGLVPSLQEAPPYRLRMPRAQEHLDHTRINCWRHRVRFLPVELGRSLGELYETDREEFYRRLHDERPPEDLFALILDAAGRVPRLHVRLPIFEQMRSLYEVNHWYGLFALALPQIEGLFAEMVALVSAKKANTYSALPDKVRAIRAYADAHDQNLDYFEFAVPRIRNRFSHAGKLDAPQIAAMEVLHDLSYVCEVMKELNAPVIELANSLSDPTSLTDFQHWVRIFDLVAKVSDDQQLTEVAKPLEAAIATLQCDDETWAARAATIAEQIRDGSARLCKSVQSTADQLLRLEVDLARRKKSKEVVHRRSEIADAIGDVEALIDGFWQPIELRRFALGLVAYAEIPSGARDTIVSAVKDTHTVHANLTWLLAASALELPKWGVSDPDSKSRS